MDQGTRQFFDELNRKLGIKDPTAAERASTLTAAA